MLVRILGSAAGGGLPQWNCGCPNCTAVRAGSPQVQPRTQSSTAVSADGRVWFLLNVSPDVRQQILMFPALGPAPGQPRGTAIGGCLLTDAEIDHTAGLLVLREGGAFGITCTPLVRRWLHEYLALGPVLAHFAERPWFALLLDAPCELLGPHGGPSGLRVRAFEAGHHVPRFVTGDAAGAAGAVVGLVVEDLRTGGRLVYAPCVSELSGGLVRAAQGAQCVLLDGTFWSDDELIRVSGSGRTARETGHLPVGGPEGSLAWFAQLTARDRAYTHINNTNPMLPLGSTQRRAVEDGGVRVAADGDQFEL